jgi:hypothetical protein
MLHNYKTWKSLNEGGWDSVDEDAGDIAINGVTLDITITYDYDTSSPSVGMSVYVKPTLDELIKIGVFSGGYSKLEQDERSILLYDHGEDLDSPSEVRKTDDGDIYDMFSDDYQSKVPDPLTTKQFIDIIKEYEWNREDQGLDDIIQLDPNLSYEENLKIALEKNPALWAKLEDIPPSIKNDPNYAAHGLISDFDLWKKKD